MENKLIERYVERRAKHSLVSVKILILWHKNNSIWSLERPEDILRSGGSVFSIETKVNEARGRERGRWFRFHFRCFVVSILQGSDHRAEDIIILATITHICIFWEMETIRVYKSELFALGSPSSTATMPWPSATGCVDREKYTKKPREKSKQIEE